MRRLAIDPGGKRTGLASGDDDARIASPLPAIDGTGSGAFVRQLRQQIDHVGAEALLLGWPVNMNGTRGGAAKSAEQLAIRLHRELGLAVLLIDERQTSDDADRLMAQSGLTHGQKKARRDGLAAAQLLVRFWAAGLRGVDPLGLPERAADLSSPHDSSA
ncbi:MAG: Holliday junction resolvase RuvX [Planctomycetota bacterium]